MSEGKALPFARTYRELVVYQRAMEVARLAFRHSKDFPKEERYALTDQLRRSSRSIGAQIAEAWGKRAYPRHFASKLSDSDSERLETQHWIDVAQDCGYFAPERSAELLGVCGEIGRMLAR